MQQNWPSRNPRERRHSPVTVCCSILIQLEKKEEVVNEDFDHRPGE
jgi:hypothetical protein